MQNPYTTSTVDAPEYKQLICGRATDVRKLLDQISLGHSVALFGERRIGKSSLLFLIRDIINDNISSYRNNLIDQDLEKHLDTFKPKTSGCKAIYLSLQAVSELNHLALTRLLYGTLHRAGWLQTSPASTKYTTLEDVFLALHRTQGNERFVVLLDEMEGLADFDEKEGKIIARHLRDIIASCSHICMIFAGAEGWHKQIKDKTSPLVNNIHSVYLKAAACIPIEEYLIKKLLSSCLPLINNSNALTHTIMLWTECKPYYVQAVCGTIVDTYETRGQLPDTWEQIIEDDVFESHKPILQAFYDGRNLDALSQDVLRLLAHKPGLRMWQIAKNVGASSQLVRDRVNDLVSFGKLNKHDSKYRIAGTLIEKWGKQNRERPVVKSRLSQRIFAFIFISLAILVGFYTHPSIKTVPFHIQDIDLSIQMPVSVEPYEHGTAIISIQNGGPQNIKAVHIFLNASDINYQSNGTNEYDSKYRNELTFTDIPPYGRESLSLNYEVDQSTNTTFSSELIVVRDGINIPIKESFSINGRILPIQQYWFLISTPLAAISGLLGGKDLLLLLINLLPLAKRNEKDGAIISNAQ